MNVYKELKLKKLTCDSKQAVKPLLIFKPFYILNPA